MCLELLSEGSVHFGRQDLFLDSTAAIVPCAAPPPPPPSFATHALLYMKGRAGCPAGKLGEAESAAEIELEDMNMVTEYTDEPTMGPSTDAAPPPASPRNAAVHLDAPGMAPGTASVAAATAVSGATTSTAAAGSSNAAASAAVAADEVHATEAAAGAGVAAAFTTPTGSAARTCGASDTKETPEAVGKVQVVGVVDGEDEERKRSRWREEEEEKEGAEVSLAGGGKGGAGAQAAAAVAGSVERTTMPQQDGGESKEKRKGKAKSCPFRIVEVSHRKRMMGRRRELTCV